VRICAAENAGNWFASVHYAQPAGIYVTVLKHCSLQHGAALRHRPAFVYRSRRPHGWCRSGGLLKGTSAMFEGRPLTCALCSFGALLGTFAGCFNSTAALSCTHMAAAVCMCLFESLLDLCGFAKLPPLFSKCNFHVSSATGKSIHSDWVISEYILTDICSTIFI
jgi:hypothetical protein